MAKRESHPLNMKCPTRGCRVKGEVNFTENESPYVLNDRTGEGDHVGFEEAIDSMPKGFELTKKDGKPWVKCAEHDVLAVPA